MNTILEFIGRFPQGVSPNKIERHLGLSRATLNRRLKVALGQGQITRTGKGPATRYQSANPQAAVRAYFEQPHTERPLARYQEALLNPEPGLQDVTVMQLEAMLPNYPLDRREMGKFLIDFSCASSVLEGGSYSLLDTQSLIDYGEKAAGKPLEDAFLVLNHKEAFECLYDHMHLDAIYQVHDLLTNDHGLAELQDSQHFLGQDFRGVVREYVDLDIALSSYIPPYRPATGYLQKMLGRIIKTAMAIGNPIQAAFYLMTRIAYLQPFKDGNKRTSRAMCNVPLVNAGLPPISFVDFAKQDYIVSLLAFYELGDTRLAESCFLQAYKKSAVRLPRAGQIRV